MVLRRMLYAVVAVAIWLFIGSFTVAQDIKANKDIQGGEDKMIKRATFAAGCFWGVEAAFSEVEGVISTKVGYTGGHIRNPTYRQVCSDATGHVETVELEYDPNRVSYDQLLDVFWDIHNPTTLNRQGLDIGSQYRSAIFFHTPEQEAAAKSSKEKLYNSGKYKGQIVTEIVPATQFYAAEEYHQKYLEKHGLPGCKI